MIGVSSLAGKAEEHPAWSLQGLCCHQIEISSL